MGRMPAAGRLLQFGLLLAASTLVLGCSRDREPPEVGGVALQQAAPYPGDPHVFACETCHTPPRVEPRAGTWRATCTRSGCHPQAWTRTIFHRVDADVFTNCTNCHRPHTWVAEGDDCNSCHASVHGPEGTVTARAIAGMPLFPHDRHARFECSTCHQLATRHADLLLDDPRQCIACHHGPPAAASCTACHAAVEFAGTRTHATRLDLHVWSAPRERILRFDHARHERFECERCHQPSPTWSPADNCASCHTEHHGARADCIECHAPPAATAHTLDVHTSNCRDCHGDASLSGAQRTRNVCLVCHQDQVQHMPQGNCADCHKLTPDP